MQRHQFVRVIDPQGGSLGRDGYARDLLRHKRAKRVTVHVTAKVACPVGWIVDGRVDSVGNSLTGVHEFLNTALFAQPAQHHRRRQDQRGRVCDIFTLDVRR